jgi:hypothetical protein
MRRRRDALIEIESDTTPWDCWLGLGPHDGRLIPFIRHLVSGNWDLAVLSGRCENEKSYTRLWVEYVLLVSTSCIDTPSLSSGCRYVVYRLDCI